LLPPFLEVVPSISDNTNNIIILQVEVLVDTTKVLFVIVCVW
jgi:hypothetical protein